MKMERTLIIAKPETVQSHNVGNLVSKFEKMGRKVIGLKMVHDSIELVEKHYREDNEAWLETCGARYRKECEAKGVPFPSESNRAWGLTVISMLRKHITESPVVAMVLEGPEAIAFGRKVVGVTNPYTATPGTFRGNFTCDTFDYSTAHNRPVRNMVHASDSESAEYEINLWFKPEELFDWKSPLQAALLKL